MIPLIKLKKDVQFNAEFTKVVDVMKGIAAARFTSLQRELSLFEPFTRAADDILGLVDLALVDHPFVRPRQGRTGVVVVTTDTGFLGGLNNQVVQAALGTGGSEGAYTVIGERGANAIKDLRMSGTIDAFPGIDDVQRLPLALAVRDHVVEQCLQGAIAKLVVVYPKPLSFSSQRVVVEPLLPANSWVTEREDRKRVDLLWESQPEGVVEYVVTKWLGHRFDEIFALSRLSELGARATHLEGSYQELGRLGKKLRHEYHRARHEMIDRSMREIFSASTLLRRAK
jgi:ATP synthase F1 gamma subunit